VLTPYLQRARHPSSDPPARQPAGAI